MATVVQLQRRCAWCGAVRVRDGWTLRDAIEDPDRLTHTICPDCVAGLRAAGKSA
jgi:hypothetical protein